MTNNEFHSAVKKCVGPDTASPSGCLGNGVMRGQCFVVSLLAQKTFGGSLVSTTIKGTLFVETHWFNWLPGTGVVDFTGEQYGAQDLKPANPDTKEWHITPDRRGRSSRKKNSRYKILETRFKKEVETWAIGSP